MSHSFAIIESRDLSGEQDKLSAQDAFVSDKGASFIAPRPNEAAANQDGAEMTRLTRELMSRLVGDSIYRALASYMEHQDITGL